MAGRSPAEAVKAFTKPIQDALSCFVAGKVTANAFDEDEPGILTFNRGQDVKLRGSNRIEVSLTMTYKVLRLETTTRSPWKVTTTGWIYAVTDVDGPVADFHWHPETTPDIAFPHIHARRDTTARHLPSGRVLIEDVLMFAVECGARPIDTDKWDRIRTRNIRDVAKSASWGVSHAVRL